MGTFAEFVGYSMPIVCTIPPLYIAPPFHLVGLLHREGRRCRIRWPRMTACNLLNGTGQCKGTLVPLMMKDSPAPSSLLKMVHCNCSTVCSTLRCGWRKHAFECTRHVVTANMATVTTWPISQYHMMTQMKPNIIHVSGSASDRRTSVSIDKPCVMFKCSLPVTPEIFLS